MKKQVDSIPNYSQYPPFDVHCKWNGKKVVFSAIHFEITPPAEIIRTWQVVFVTNLEETRINELKSAHDYEICFQIIDQKEVKLYKLTSGLFRVQMRGRKWKGKETKQVHFKFASRDLLTVTAI